MVVFWLQENHPKIFLVTLLPLSLFGMLLMSLMIFSVGPTGIADTLLFWRKRRELRKQLVSSSRPTAIHIVHKRQSNGIYFITTGYQMDDTSYVSKNEKMVSEEIYNLHENYNTPKVIVFDHHTSLEWNNGCFLGNISAQYPASGPFYYNDNFNENVDNLSLPYVRGWFAPINLLFTVMMAYWVLGDIMTALFGTFGAGGRGTYYVTAGVTTLTGVLNATYYYFYWRKATLNAYQIVDELPTMTIEDNNENVHELEMLMPVVCVDDDTVISEEYASDDNQDSIPL